MTLENSRPTTIEQWTGRLVLFALILIAATILAVHEHGRRSPSDTSFDTLPGKMQHMTPNPSGTTPSSLAGVLESLNDVEAVGPMEHFTGERLADKIDGKAELYISAGFQHLITQRFRLVHDPQLWFEMFHYDMGRAAGAFAVFSTQRREGARVLEFVPQGYVTSNALFLTIGSGYFELVGSRADPRLLAAMERGAQALARDSKGHPTSWDVPAPEALFPAARMKPGSLALLAADAFGFQGLDQVYTVQYQYPAGEITAYITTRGSIDEANDLSAVYGQFLFDFGGRNLAPSRLPDACRAIEILDLYEVVCVKGSNLFGVHEAPELDGTVDLIRTMADHMEKMGNGSQRE